MGVRASQIGPYEIVAPLGAGGMGTVYRGRHIETDQEAAVKSVDTVRPELMDRLRREIDALAGSTSARPMLEEARQLVQDVGAETGSEAVKALAKLRRAQEAWEAGEHGQLFRGVTISELTVGQRQWLLDQGHIRASQAGMATGSASESAGA